MTPDLETLTKLWDTHRSHLNAVDKIGKAAEKKHHDLFLLRAPLLGVGYMNGAQR